MIDRKVIRRIAEEIYVATAEHNWCENYEELSAAIPAIIKALGDDVAEAAKYIDDATPLERFLFYLLPYDDGEEDENYYEFFLIPEIAAALDGIKFEEFAENDSFWERHPGRKIDGVPQGVFRGDYVEAVPLISEKDGKCCGYCVLQLSSDDGSEPQN